MEPLAARTLPALIAACARRYPDREAVVDVFAGVFPGVFPGVDAGVDAGGETRLTYAGLAHEAGGFSRALIAAGVEPGDRVAVWAPNGWRWIVAALGIVSTGAVLVPLNTRFKGPEAGYILGKTRARVLIVHDGFLGNGYVDMLADEELPHLSTVVTFDAWDDFVAAGLGTTPAEAQARAEAVKPEDVSDIFFTSGTTGRPKGAMLTHEQSTSVYVAWSELATLRDGDRYLLVNPMFNTFGYKAGMVACLLRGATIVPQPVFDVATTLDLIVRERITVMPGPPTLYTSILDHPARGDYDLSSLRVAVTGATTVPVVMIERLRSEMRLETVVTAYGLTETCGTATMCRPTDDPVVVATTCGPAIPGVEVMVAGADGRKLPAGEPGEILVRGYNVMPGYFEDPEATADAVDAQGWLRTGDVGVLDERGYLRITDRVKDMFIVGGFNTYPAEIEQTLARHEAVAEVAVIGVPDERLGEVGRAYIVRRPAVAATEPELIEFCRTRLANYKVPRSVIFLEELPRTATGKILKRELRH